MEEKESFLSEYGFEIIKILLSGALALIALFVGLSEWVKITLCASAAVIAGLDLLIGLPSAVKEKEFFGENTLMLIASAVAFAVGEYPEGALILVLFSLGELLEDIATDNSHKKIAGLAEMRVDFARLVVGKAVVNVKPEEVKIGSVIEVRRGDRVPIDGQLLSDSGEFDLKAITGESKIYEAEKGDAVFGGGINEGDAVRIVTTEKFCDSAAERIIAMVEKSEAKKAKSQKFITSFAKIYTPCIIALALFIAVLPPIFNGYNFTGWIIKALNFMVISCPCALVISVPLAYFVGIGSLARHGVLVKGGNYLETLARAKVFVSDKTGTLTEGKFSVAGVFTDGCEKSNLIDVAYSLEKFSSHPVAAAIYNFCKNENAAEKEVNDVREIAGVGVCGIIGGKHYYVGGKKLLKSINASVTDKGGTIIYVVCEKNVLGGFILEDSVKSGAEQVIAELKSLGIKDFYILSGDDEYAVEKTAEKTGVKNAYHSLMPDDKLIITEELIKKGKGVIYAGDGINDAPTLKLSDVGIAMGGLGSQAAIESADVVIMDDDIKKIAVAKSHAKKVRKIVAENIVVSLAVKFAVMAVSLFTFLPVYAAMAADVGVMIMAVLNSLRCYRVKKFPSTENKNKVIII